MPETPSSLALVADVVCAYVSKNSLPATDVPELLQIVYRALSGLGSAPECKSQSVSRSVPREMGIAGRLSDGCAGLRCKAVGFGKGVGIGRRSQEQEDRQTLKKFFDRCRK
jgi:hypothetical protein